MMPSAPPEPNLQRPSVADAKRVLNRWGVETDTQTSRYSSKLGVEAKNIALKAGIGIFVFLTVRRLLSSRSPRVARDSRSTRSSGAPQITHGDEASKVGYVAKVKPLAVRLGWLAIGRASRWILPHALGAVHNSLTRSRESRAASSSTTTFK